MIKKISRIAVIAVMGSVLMSQIAFADTVEVANAPGDNTSVSSSQNGITKSGTNIIYSPNSGNNVISQTGPTETKPLNENGVFVYNAATSLNATDHISTIGPGGGSLTQNTTQQGSTAAPSNTNTNTNTQTSSQITIDQSIAKPSVTAEAAILMDAATGQILFEKNADEKLYPASTTKLMTSLLAAEKLNLTDTVKFNSSAVNGLESGATTAGMKAGDTMSVNDALHAVLLRSACEVANALGESVSGSASNFAALMNQKAAELGCTNTHFENASGLNNSNHYTTVRDMALITRAALANDTVRTISQKYSYKLPKTANRGELTITNTCKFVKGGTDALTGYIGGKTGYTSKAGSCLASAATINGRELVAVVFKASSPNQFKDARALYEYGTKLTATGTNSAAAVNNNAGGAWEKTSDGHYKYKKANGSYCANEWLDVNGSSYFFDGTGIMCTGWKSFTNGSVYYFNPENGAMVKNKWVAQDGKSYYMQNDGTMARNTTIDNKYQVDANGVYVKKVG